MTPIPCAIYTRKSSEEGLEQSFNSLDAQRESCAAYVLSQKAQGWKVVEAYDDGGFSGGTMERPGLQRLMADIRARRIKVIVVYKVDRLTRSLADFAKLVELFDAHEVSFVSVTQQFNTTTSMGRLTLNVLLSFAQFEREITGERIRDKIATSKRKGMWMGGHAPMGYLPSGRTLVIDDAQAQRVQEIFSLYLNLRSVYALKAWLDERGWKTPERTGKRIGGNRPFTRGHLYRLLSNPIYIGQIRHKSEVFAGQHPAIVDEEVFRAAQALLAENAQAQELRSDAAEPSLLAGITFDGQGRRWKPTHAKKRGKRYRYYFCPGDGDEETLRMPAPALEGAVQQMVMGLLNDDGRLLALMEGVDAGIAKARLATCRTLAEQLSSGPSASRLLLLKRLLNKVVVEAASIRAHVNRSAMGWPSDDDGTVELHVPDALQRGGRGVRLVVHAEPSTEPRQPDRRLVALLSKAQKWFESLRNGEHPSVLSLAQANGTASGDAIRIVYLAFLAPDLVQRIARGEQPAGLGVKRLLELAPLPMDWNAQRRALGFES